MPHTFNAPFIRRSLLVSAALVSAVLAQPAQTQEKDEVLSLAAVSVTGSNIRRVDAETALPLTVISAQDIEARGASTMAELMETLNIAEPSGITEINTGVQSAMGDVASIDLRGMGSGSSLVLLNGRRMAPHPISMTENGVPSLAPNINSIPRAMIERVEILRDGASAIYGADAAAGVLNTIVSRHGTRSNLTLRGSTTQHGGAGEFETTVSDSFTRGATHVSLSFDYFHRDSLAASDRWYSKNSDLRVTHNLPAPWNGLPITLPDGTVYRNNNFTRTGNPGQYTTNWVRGNIQPDYLTFNGSRPANNTGISTAATPTNGVATVDAKGNFYIYRDTAGNLGFKQAAISKNIDGGETQNYDNNNAWLQLIPKTDRYQAAAFLDRPLNARLAAFGDVLFYGAHSRTQFEPPNMKNNDDAGIYIPASNPWNPFGVRFYDPQGRPNADGTPRLVGTPADVSPNTGSRWNPERPRSADIYSYSWRTLAGVRGRFGDTWQWESALLASQAQTHQYIHNMFRESLVRQALARTDSTALNPFGATFKIVNGMVTADQVFQNPASVIDPLLTTEDRSGRTGLYSWDAKANGRLWRLFNGGEIGVAAGTEVRYETYQDRLAVYSGMNPPGSGALFPLMREGDNDILNIAPSLPITAHETIFAGYSEVALPFVTHENRKPLLEELELSLAGRFEHYSVFGQTTKPKASLVWNPFRSLKLRGSVAESFRAPNLVQTNVTPLKRNASGEDYYRHQVTGLLKDGSTNRAVIRQGNENLKPETAQTWSAGFVLEVPKVPGLSVTFDYFHINQKQVIEDIGVASTLDRDQLLLDLATQAALAAGKSIDQIDLGSNTANYLGSPKVTRLPVDAEDRAAFAAYNAQQKTNATKRAPVGQLVSVVDDYVNLAGRDIQGYELGLQWRVPRMPIGQFNVGAEVTHNIVRRTQDNASSPWFDELERGGVGTKWRGTLHTSWRRNSWSAGWFMSYFGPYVATAGSTTQAVYEYLGRPHSIRAFNDNGVMRYYSRIDAFTQHNAWLGYRFDRNGDNRWLRDVSVRLSINNVFDSAPPLAPADFGFKPGTANPRGRQFGCEITRAF